MVRDKLFEVIESVEAKTGSHAYAFALDGDEQVLVVSDALTAALKNHQLGDLLEPSFQLLFTTRATKRDVIKNWPSTIKSFSEKRNDADTLKGKASILACYILNHYDIPCDVLLAETSVSPQIDEDVEIELKLEAAASWYRLIDELAFRFIRNKRDLFSDYLQDSLAELLALQGATPDAITSRVVERSTEYAGIKDWIREAGEEASSLLWQMGKHALAPLGVEKNYRRIHAHSRLLLRALEQAMVRELLLGQQNRT